MMEFEQIYHIYFKQVFRYAVHLCGDEQLAEELTSETFFNAMKSIGDFRGDCDIRVWLCQIAKNSYYSYLKKHKKLSCLDELDRSEVIDPTAFIDDNFIELENAGQIRTALHELSDPYKEVFMWRVFGELSFKEIGKLYGKTDNWACVTYHRARKMIQSRLEEIEHEK